LTKVLASGVFDLLHYGHIRFLEEAKRLGGPNAKLVVVVATDDTVRKNKGRDPVIPESQRRALVESLRVVDEAILGYKDMDLESVLDRVKPDIVAVGHDQEEIMKQVLAIKDRKDLRLKVVQVGRFGEEDLNSSSKIRRKILNDSKRRA
jgi:FAD synthetase